MRPSGRALWGYREGVWCAVRVRGPAGEIVREEIVREDGVRGEGVRREEVGGAGSSGPTKRRGRGPAGRQWGPL